MPDPAAEQPRNTGVFLVVVLTILLNALALWVVVKLLNSAGAIEWDIPWRHCSALSAIFVITRAWDRGLFGRR
jgi:hypothetical protein